MGGIVGGITDAIGLTDHKGQAKAQASADRAAGNSYALSKEAIAFQKEQYKDWKAIYGDIQENLGEYYKNLTPEKLTSVGLVNQQKEYQMMKLNLEKEFAQKGISGSGVETAMKTSLAFQNAEARAGIRTGAEEAVAEKKLQFLGVGLGQGTAMLGNIAGVTTAGAATQANIAGQYLGQATQYGTNNQAAMSDLIGSAAYIAGKK